MNSYKHDNSYRDDPYVVYYKENSFHCILCNASLLVKNLRSHLEGRRHREALCRETVKKEGMMEIIRNDPYIVCSNGGSLQCILCNESLQPKYLNEHLQGTEHQKLLHLQSMIKERILLAEKAREEKNYLNLSLPYKWYLNAKTTLEATTVLIKDLPDSLTQLDIHQHFSSFGRLTKQNYFNENNSYALIQFCESESLIALRNGDATIKGIKLDIKSIGEIALQNYFDFIKINQTLKEAPDFQAQLNILMDHLQPEWLTSHYELICSDLQDRLKHTFPGCAVLPFGAASTGLGFTTSTVYLHVEYNRHLQNETLKEDYIIEIKQIMENDNLVFLHTPPIVQYSKCKDNFDVKCVHNATQLNCNIYFTQSESVRSSSLIRCYLSMTDKLKPLIIIIKYWAKMHKLLEKPYFSSYALTLLLIFYLQQTPYYLPPVKSLQSIKGSPSADFVLHQKIDIEPLDQSIPEILQGFFNYYANFEYAFYVICPYLGKLVLKSDFFANENIQHNKNLNDFLTRINPRMQYRKNKTMPIFFLQNPLEHSYNVTRLVPDHFLNRFVGLCRASAEISKNRIDDHLSLYKLFTYCRSSIPETENYNNDATGCRFHITMNEHLGFINSEIQKNNIVDLKEKSIQTIMIWYNLVKKFLISIITDLMKFDVNIIDDDSPKVKSRRLNEQLDVHDTNTIDSITLHCSRSGISNIKDVVREGAVLTGINLVNQSKLMQLISKKSLFLYAYRLTLNMQTKFNPTQVIISLSHVNSGEKHCYEFVKLFAQYFPKWFEKYMTELDAQSLKYKRVNTNEQLHDDESDDSNESEFVANDNDDFKYKQAATVPKTECQRVQIKDDPDNIQSNLTDVFQVKSEPIEAELETENKFIPGFVKVLVNETGRLLELQDFEIEARRINNTDVTYDKPEFIKVLNSESEYQSYDKVQIKLEPENFESEAQKCVNGIEFYPIHLSNNQTELKTVAQIKSEPTDN